MLRTQFTDYPRPNEYHCKIANEKQDKALVEYLTHSAKFPITPDENVQSSKSVPYVLWNMLTQEQSLCSI